MTDRSSSHDAFRRMRDARLPYVDKSGFIAQVIDCSAHVALLMRPRRFGRSLAVSMLRDYFEKSDRDASHLFADLRIWEMGEQYREHFQRYPVLVLSFSGVDDGDDAATCRAATLARLRGLVKTHWRVLERRAGAVLRHYERFVVGEEVEPAFTAGLLLDLSKCLADEYRQDVIVLIDDYDAPAVAAYSHSAREDRRWYEHFLSAGLKDNPYLHRAVLLGSLGVAAPNNVALYPPNFSGFDGAFGFTDVEVEALLGAGARDQLPRIRRECGGYVIGGLRRTTVYCPASVMTFLANGGRELRLPSAHGLVRNPAVVDVLSRLLQGESTTLRSPARGVRLDEPSSDDVLWRLILLGYLTAEEISRGSYDYPEFRVTIPNEAMARSVASMRVGSMVGG